MRLETIEASEDAKPRYRYLQPCNRHKTKREGIGLVRGTTWVIRINKISESNERARRQSSQMQKSHGCTRTNWGGGKSSNTSSSVRFSARCLFLRLDVSSSNFFGVSIAFLEKAFRLRLFVRPPVILKQQRRGSQHNRRCWEGQSSNYWFKAVQPDRSNQMFVNLQREHWLDYHPSSKGRWPRPIEICCRNGTLQK